MGVYNAGLLFLQATEPVHLHDTAGSPNPSKDQKSNDNYPKEIQKSMLSMNIWKGTDQMREHLYGGLVVQQEIYMPC
jgi:hypothetical protein